MEKQLRQNEFGMFEEVDVEESAEPILTELYHPILGQMTAQSEDERDEALSKGWSLEYVAPNEEGMLAARIIEVETDLRQMRKNLASLKGEEYEDEQKRVDAIIEAVRNENLELTATVDELTRSITEVETENVKLKKQVEDLQLQKRVPAKVKTPVKKPVKHRASAKK